MKDFKKLVNYILTHDGTTIELITKHFMYLFTGDENRDKFYGVREYEDGFILTYLEENPKLKRVEVKISKQIQL